MLFPNSKPDKNRTSPTEKWLCHKLRTTLPLLIASTESVAPEKPTVTQNLRLKIAQIYPRNIGTDRKNLWEKEGIVSQNNCSWSYNTLNEGGNVLARNCCHLIQTTERFNIKHYNDNAKPISNRSAHLKSINDNQLDKPTFKNIYIKKIWTYSQKIKTI